ncbi:MAG: hypothetical protein MZV63_42900 [Marinilabiliales bacterium]|nr:hypothetical protein [Marinilabiliales bacterium]
MCPHREGSSCHPDRRGQDEDDPGMTAAIPSGNVRPQGFMAPRFIHTLRKTARRRRELR